MISVRRVSWVMLLAIAGSAVAATDGASFDCRAHDEASWHVLDTNQRRDKLDAWCSAVGKAEVAKPGSNSAEIRNMIVVSWNVHVGGGNVEAMLEQVRKLAREEGSRTGMVLLLQEAYRAGPAIPVRFPRDAVPATIQHRNRTVGIADIAKELGMSGIYVPSMRNGKVQEDRGNAILSTEPLQDIEAIELPFGKQRRVAVMCFIHPRGGATPIRVVSIHFDTNGDRTLQAKALAERLQPMAREEAPLILAGDFNSLWGRRDGSYKAIEAFLEEQPCGRGWTNVWPARLDIFFGWWRGRIDFIFRNAGASGSWQRTGCETLRDRHHSDHHPVVMQLASGS